MRVAFASLVMGCSLLLIGCGQSNKTAPKAGTGVVEYDVFPTEVIVMKPGETKETKMSRKGKDLKDANVTVSSDDPKVTVEGGSFKGDAKDAVVTIKAAPEAEAKEHKITVKAGDVTKTLTVRVEGPAVDSGKAPPPPDEKAKKEDKK